jgi:serine/threonine protein phosphatase PrpC
MDLSSMLDIANVSDVGRRRPHNEDSTLSDPVRGVVILADGMGGYKAGEVASAIAVTTIHHQVCDGLKKLRRSSGNRNGIASPEVELLRNAVIEANSGIYATAQRDPQCHGMGTTVVVGLFSGQRLTIAHVGDSRLYRLRANQFQQITRDHSLIQELIDRGLYTPEEAAKNAPKNLVTRALGIEQEVKVDLREEEILPKDVFLLCSDGLNDMVDDEEIHLTLSKYSANLVQAAEELARLANAKGGKDNISVILIRVKKTPSNPGGPLARLVGRFS